jgi:xylulokinase
VTTVLGIDIGTSGSKGVLADADGRVLATAERPHRIAMPRPGWFEHDAGEWWQAVVALSRQLLADGAGRDLAGVCVSGMGPCVLLADAAGEPLRPAILYGVDTRAQAEIEELDAELGRDAILARSGGALNSQSAGPKLLWLRRHEPELWARARHVLMPSSYAVLRLTGAYVLDHHSASQCAPLYDLDRAAWDAAVAARVAGDLPLPRLLWPAEVAGTVTASAAAATGIPAGTPVVAGTIDAWSEAVSAGVERDGDLMLMYGSTMFMIGLGADLAPDERLWLAQWVTPGRRSRAAGLATSGSLTTWLAELTSASYEQLAAEAAAVPAGSGGIVALPYFAGERTPLHDPLARGVIVGLHQAHGRGHLYRALLEGTAFAVRHNLDAMRDAGDVVRRVVAVGGGTRTALWPQIVADATGLAQDVPRVTIGAAYGDARLAAIGAGLDVDPAAWAQVDHVVEPTAATAPLYAALYDIYRDLYPQTKQSVHALARRQQEA